MEKSGEDGRALKRVEENDSGEREERGDGEERWRGRGEQ